MSLLSIKDDNGVLHEFAKGTSASEVVKKIKENNTTPIAVEIDGIEKDLSFKIENNCDIKIITGKSEEGLYILRHSCAHLLAQAVTTLFPEAKPTIGPPVDNGFYYDFYMDPINEQDLKNIENLMKKIIKKRLNVEREEYDNKTIREMFSENKFKMEILDEKVGEESGTSAYRQGDFVDLCRGPHVSNTSFLRWFKLTNTSQAYWRADAKRESLVRIYGMCYSTKEELKERQRQIEEASKRDHKKIGKEMELYTINEMIGKGLPIWLPNGEILKNQIENYAIDVEEKYGYQRVTTPVLGKKELFEASGHLPHYAESMYPAMEMDDGTYYLKAMNCPMHHLIFKDKKRSYRELPVRIAEYGTVYRNELSGTLAGLLRVRMLSMNDAHIYCRLDQVAEEFAHNIKMVQEYYETFGFKDYYFRLSLWDPDNKSKYIDQPKNWEITQNHLRTILEELNVNYEEVVGEAAFYGPKVDIQFKTLLGREESMSTIQLDFAAKDRFNLSFMDKTGNENNDVFVIHRAPLSTHERFTAFLTEHWAGNFPTWLSPIQVKIITISENHVEYGKKVEDVLKNNNIRVDSDYSDNTIGKKIRLHRKMRPAYMIIIGEDEQKNNSVSIRKRNGEQKNDIPLNEFVELLSKECGNKEHKNIF